MTSRLIALISLITLVAACSTTTETPLPTLAAIPLPAITITVDPVVQEPTATPTQEDPTPTREGFESSPTEVTGDLGSGFGLGDEPLEAGAFSADVTGAATGTLSGPGYYGCENGRYALRTPPEGLDNVTLLLPANITPGQYRLQQTNNQVGTVAAMVTFDSKIYAGFVDGILILNTVANEPGQLVSGNFEFTASNGSANLTVRGEFEFLSTDDVPYCGGS